MRAALLLIVLAMPAFADEHERAAYGHILTGCYDAATDTEARTACIGAMSSACMETEEFGETTLGMSTCILAEAAVWDEYLNAEYKAARAWAKAADEAEAAYFPEYAHSADALLAAQRAWIGFRDAECGFAFAMWGSGSMRYIGGANCRVEMTAERTIELRAMRGEFQ